MKKFICMVRQLPCLWDMESRDYRNKRKKDKAWLRIVVELKHRDIPDVKTAKAEWKKLRDSHRDSLKRAKASANGHENAVINKWKYADVMDFLVPYMKSRKQIRLSTSSSEENEVKLSSLSPTDSFSVQPTTSYIDANFDSSIDKSMDIMQDTEHKFRKHSSSSEENEIKESCPSPADSFSIQSSTSNIDANFDSSIDNDIDTTQHTEHKFRKRKPDNDFSELMIEVNDRNGSRFGESNKHPLDSFFESMCETTKQFPRWLQYRVKRKIFNVISEAEDTFEKNQCKSPKTIFRS